MYINLTKVSFRHEVNSQLYYCCLLIFQRAKGNLSGTDSYHHQAGLQPGHPVLCLHLHQEVVAGWRQHQGHWQRKDIHYWRNCRGCQCIWEHTSGCGQNKDAGKCHAVVLAQKPPQEPLKDKRSGFGHKYI